MSTDLALIGRQQLDRLRHHVEPQRILLTPGRCRQLGRQLDMVICV